MTTLQPIPIHLLNEHDIAEHLRVSVATVRRWRILRQGPTFIKIGAAVRYKPEDLAAWLDSRPSGGSEIPSEASETPGRVSEASAATSRRRGNRHA
jgi:hypothetical protein